jgi:Tol biopolymer transport system component
MFNWRNLGDLAYMQSGDIYFKELPKGRPSQLTHDGLNSSPRISPSGKWLAFRKADGQLWIMKTDGQSANLVHSGKIAYFKWAPGSDLLAFIVSGELRTLQAGGTESRLIVPSPPQEHTGANFEFVWSADGKWIACEYTEKKEVPESEWQWKNSIRKVNVENGEFEEIIAYPPPDREGVPGNTALAAWVGSKIYLWQCRFMSASIMADGCPLYYIDLHKKQNEAGATSLLYRDFLAFSPDGGTLAVSEGADRLTWSNKRIKIINQETREENVLTEPELIALSPVWSPDGFSLAYVAGPDIGPEIISESNVLSGMAGRRIWILKADGSEKRQLTSDDVYREECPVWLADGKHILFARFDAQGKPSLWLIREDGKSLQKVTDVLSAFLTEYESVDFYGHFHKEKLCDLSIAAVRNTISGPSITMTTVLFLAAVLIVIGIFAGRVLDK